MMKIKNKQVFNRKILMTLVVGTNVIWGAQRHMPNNRRNYLDEYVVTATRTELSKKEVPQSVEVITKRGYPEYRCNQCYRCFTYGD